MSELPNLFIGSSVESIELARQVQLSLEFDCASQVWDQGVFAAGGITLDSLIAEAKKSDFAVLIFSADDQVKSRDVTYNSPRDNILFELGLFVGLLGRERTFMLIDKDNDVKIPSDLAGVTPVEFRRNDLGVASYLGPATIRIKNAIAAILKRDRLATSEPLPPVGISEDDVKRRVGEHDTIDGVDAPEPTLDSWHRTIVPVLRQSTYYTTPTYYLDSNLNVVGWNIAFELIFEDVAHRVLYRHVTEFIARLVNYEDVFRHAHSFTDQKQKGELPFTDDELLVYRSIKFGLVEFQKVATQLHSASGELKGWCVSLFIKKIEWPVFERDLKGRIWQDKLWGVYASAYDKVLKGYPPYVQLLNDIGAAIPDGGLHVVDIGAGTGNSSEVLLDRGFRVTSVESSPEMIDRMRQKTFDDSRHTIVKSRAEHVSDVFRNGPKFDAATLVNVLYSVDNPYQCLCGVRDILNPGAIISLSTTHSGITLTPLLDDIKRHLKSEGKLQDLLPEYTLIREINEEIERKIAKRTSSSTYRELLNDAGFEIVKFEERTYMDAVMLVHARKR